jgi:hypothetical protein
VIPAVFETAELMRSFGWMQRFGAGPRFRATPATFIGLFVVGLLMFVAMLIWPKVFYAFVGRRWSLFSSQSITGRGDRIFSNNCATAIGAQSSRFPLAH